MKKLNSNQIRFMLTHWFGPSDLVKIFETTNLDYLCKQKFEIDDLNTTWPAVYMNGQQYTTINTAIGRCKQWLSDMMKLKA